MKTYATTFPALVNQAIEMGCSPNDLAVFRRTHDLAEMAVDGIYRAQSVPLICHLVRAASIMLDERQPIEVVQVAMLHGLYRIGTFRDSRRKSVNNRHRQQVRDAVGQEVEALLWTYDQLPWYDLESVKQHLEQLDNYDDTTKHALRVRLADYLDDHLDRAMAYAGRVYDDDDARVYCETCCKLATALSSKQLAEAIKAAYESNFEIELPDEVVMHRTRGYERSRRHLWEKPLIASLPIDLLRRTYRLLTQQQTSAGLTYGNTVCETCEPKRDR